MRIKDTIKGVKNWTVAIVFLAAMQVFGMVLMICLYAFIKGYFTVVRWITGVDFLAW